jgi:hypothetical protein
MEACPDPTTAGGDFSCADGSGTIPGSYQCDAEDDCFDGSDEVGCQYLVCPATGEELPLDWQCDGWDDCGDGSDEVGCESLAFACADGQGMVPTEWVCDLEPDCADGSDEAQGCAQWVCN